MASSFRRLTRSPAGWGWFLVLAANLYRAVDAWSNLEFSRSKMPLFLRLLTHDFTLLTVTILGLLMIGIVALRKPPVEVAKATERAEVTAQSKIAVEFDKDDSQCNFQDHSIRARIHIIRLRLRNKSDEVKLQQVRVRVEGMNEDMPQGAQWLQFQHDAGVDQSEESRYYPDSIQGYDLAPGETVYVNLLGRYHVREPQVHFANPIYRQAPLPNPVRFDIAAYAYNSPPARVVARITRDDDGYPVEPYCELETRSA